MDSVEARRPQSPRFGSPSSTDENTHTSPEQSIFANIAERIGDLSKPVEPSFWMRGLKPNFQHEQQRIHLNRHDSSIPSTPSTCSVTGRSDKQLAQSNSESPSSSSGSNKNPDSSYDGTSDEHASPGTGSSDSDIEIITAGEEEEVLSPSNFSRDESSSSGSPLHKEAEHFSWLKLAEEAFRANFPKSKDSYTSRTTTQSSAGSIEQRNAINLLIDKLETRLRAGASPAQSIALVEALKVMMEDSSAVAGSDTCSSVSSRATLTGKSASRIDPARGPHHTHDKTSSISTNDSAAEDKYGTDESISRKHCKGRKNRSRLKSKALDASRRYTNSSTEDSGLFGGDGQDSNRSLPVVEDDRNDDTTISQASSSTRIACEGCSTKAMDKNNENSDSRNGARSVADILAALASLVDSRQVMDLPSTKKDNRTLLEHETLVQHLEEVNADLREQISHLTRRLEEAKQLTSEQAENMNSTMATLEQVDQERNVLKQVVNKLKLCDAKKGEFIVQLQRELSAAEEEKSGYRVLLRDAEAGRLKLTEEILESRAQYDDTERKLRSEIEEKDESLLKLTKTYEEFKAHSAQIEQDLVDVVYVCKKYRNVIRSRNQNRSGGVKRGWVMCRGEVRETIHGCGVNLASRGTQSGECFTASTSRKELMLAEDIKQQQKQVSWLKSALDERSLHVEQLEFLLKCQIELTDKLKAEKRRKKPVPHMRASEASSSSSSSSGRCSAGAFNCDSPAPPIATYSDTYGAPVKHSNQRAFPGRTPVYGEDEPQRRIYVPPPASSRCYRQNSFLECGVRSPAVAAGRFMDHRQQQFMVLPQISEERSDSGTTMASSFEQMPVINGQKTPEFGLGSREVSSSAF